MSVFCFKGCRRTSSNKPIATDCNACRNLKNAITGECVEKCPEGLEEKADKTCVGKSLSDLLLMALYLGWGGGGENSKSDL